MKTYLNALKRRKRKARHVRFMENKINLLNGEIIRDVISGNNKLKVYNKARLLNKYNRRLKLILY
mgnify:CR=1 FL=1|tara:strand:+ start:2679 stop:2873 length:195 start_codon:yes stop_codon:yes gene_type:complete